MLKDNFISLLKMIMNAVNGNFTHLKFCEFALRGARLALRRKTGCPADIDKT